MTCHRLFFSTERHAKKSQISAGPQRESIVVQRSVSGADCSAGIEYGLKHKASVHFIFFLVAILNKERKETNMFLKQAF